MKFIWFLLDSSFDDLRRNKARTFLTSLGILIGVLSVVLMLAFGYGLQGYIEKQFETLGKTLIMILPGQGFGGSGGAGLIGGVTFDEKDVNKVKKVTGVESVAPVFTKMVKAEANGKSQYSSLVASTPEIFSSGFDDVDYGRLFTKTDVNKKAKVAVIGSKIAEKLFGSNKNAIGKTIRIQNQRFTVIGTFPKKGGGALGSDIDTHLIIPYTAAFSFNPDKTFFAIYLKAKDDKIIGEVKADIKKTLLKRYKEDDFTVTEQAELLGTVNSIFAILNTVLIAIGSISLIVGGIGIMNIMYATVTDRTKEIGVRRAIGATKRDILLQFLSEALILSLLGGFLGLLIAVIIVILIQPLFPAVINAYSVVVGFGISSLIGIFFGVFPARRAAQLSPIEAIRYE
ncbi:MAG: ABC transporter permease [Patescibacteria group bacterium]|nr:ABC transporter permease [Patescibacteria group bacterium]